ncbi:MAG: condensation domain-containing protein, partial [Betaproteobacteria bacterium]
QRLPDYMVPSAFVTLEQLPLTTNGKLDRRALPEPSMQSSAEQHRAPTNAIEETLCQLFAELTGTSPVGLDDNFFAIGGHSLLAMHLVSRIHAATGQSISLRTIFEHSTVVALAHELLATKISTTTATKQRSTAILGQGATGPKRALSYGQIRMWALEQIEQTNSSYNMPTAMRISGKLVTEALDQSIADVISRHEPLRTVIRSEQGEPVGYVRDFDATVQLLEHADLSNLPADEQALALEGLIEQQSTQLFDLSHDLMLKASLLKLGTDEHVLIIVMHHIAGDGVSMGVFCRDLAEAYQSRSRNEQPAWTPLPIAYADHAAWKRQWLEESGELQAQSKSWQAELDGIPELLTLPTDYPRDANRSRTAGYLAVEISAATTQTLQSLANAHHTTLFTVLIAMYGLLLGRLANQNDVVIGSPVAGRTTPEVDHLVGFFVNTLALRVDSSGHPDLDTLIERVKHKTQHALTHQDLPFERLVEDLGVPRSLSHAPVFQAMLAWQTQDASTISLTDLTLSPISVKLSRSKFDLALFIAPDTDGAIRGAMEYDASLFHEKRMSHWIKWFIESLDHVAMLTRTRMPVDTVPLGDQFERNEVLERFNQPSRPSGISRRKHASQTILDLFEQQVGQSPSVTALTFEQTKLSYRDLDQRTNQLARDLMAKGIGPEHIVAVALPRSVEMIVALLAVLKTGAAYLPLDPDYPTSRLTYMLKDSGASLIITQSDVIKHAREDLAQGPAPITILDLNEADTTMRIAQHEDSTISSAERRGQLSDENLAYVIYTSGSTGNPKGVQISHRALLNFLCSMQGQPGFSENEALLAVTTVSFDIAGLELYLPLVVGGSIVLVDRA